MQQLTLLQLRRIDLYAAEIPNLQDMNHCLQVAVSAAETQRCIYRDTWRFPSYPSSDTSLNNSLQVLALQDTNLDPMGDYNNRLQVYDKLNFLQITTTRFKEFLINIQTHFPVLKVLDMSHDLENIECTDEADKSLFASFLTDALLFHPNLQLFISVNNFASVSSLEKQDLSTYTRVKDITSEAHLENQRIFWQDCNFTISEQVMRGLNSNRTLQCDVIKCIFQLNALPCSHDYISYDPQ